MEGSQVKGEQRTGSSQKKKIFVAGATGSTGKRIVEQLLAKGFSVKAGFRDVEKAKSTLPRNNTDLQIPRKPHSVGSTKLAEAISDDSEAVICATGFRPSWDLCATGFRPSWDLTAPWKVDNFGTVNLVEACQKRHLFCSLRPSCLVYKFYYVWK